MAEPDRKHIVVHLKPMEGVWWLQMSLSPTGEAITAFPNLLPGFNGPLQGGEETDMEEKKRTRKMTREKDATDRIGVTCSLDVEQVVHRDLPFIYFIYLFIYLTFLVYICKTTICSSQKHRNMSYTGVTRQRSAVHSTSHRNLDTSNIKF